MDRLLRLELAEPLSQVNPLGWSAARSPVGRRLLAYEGAARRAPPPRAPAARAWPATARPL